MYSIGEFSKLIGKSKQTLRNWHKKGTLIPEVVSNYGTRTYSEKQKLEYFGQSKKTYFKCRCGKVKA